MSVMDQVNSGSTKAQAIFDEAVLYPNPYMVVTRKGYTKHYYAGTERLATVIGQGGFADVTYPTDKFLPYEKNIVASFYSRYLSTYDPFYYHGTLGNLVKTTDIHGDPNPDLQYQCKPTDLEFVDVLNQSDMLLKSISSNEHINNDEKEKFFYHGDHLGSASWITDYQGNPVQYIHYAPYGELIVNQTPHNYYDERYKFTGKERDTESGYDMFGARYLWSDAGIFISPDPLSDKTPEISSYAYCSWDPINKIDPDGRYSVENIEGGTDYKTILVLPTDQVIDKMKPKDRAAFYDSYRQARAEKMPVMRVDDAEDYVNAMNALEGMNSNTESYVLATSHGYKKNGTSALMIGSDVFTNKKGDFSQFSKGLTGKTMFITACSLAADKSGVDLIERFATSTSSTIIGAEFPVPALLGGFRGGSLSNSPIRNAICNLFGGYCENSFKITNGINTNTVYGLTIDKNRGIRWNCR